MDDYQPRYRPCLYCRKEIDTDYPGWGLWLDESLKIFFHSECLEMWEEVKLLRRYDY